jgi:hypothetical protein
MIDQGTGHWDCCIQSSWTRFLFVGPGLKSVENLYDGASERFVHIYIFRKSFRIKYFDSQVIVGSHVTLLKN